MTKRLYIYIILLLGLWSGSVVAQEVTNVRHERNGKELIITYDLDKQADIRVSVSIDSGSTYSAYLNGLSGDIGKGVKPGTGKRILVYDLPELRFVPDDMSDQIVFNVEVDDGTVTVRVAGVEIRMVEVKGGTFTMGCTHPQQAGHYYKEELPTHKVTLNDYYIAQTEVTQLLWRAVMGSKSSGVSI